MAYPTNPFEEVIEKVSKHGWTAVSVFHGHNTPAFTYSVGFTETFGGPEIVILGIPVETARSLISGIAQQMKSKELRFPKSDTTMSGVIQDYEVSIRHIPEEQVSEIAKYAHAYAFPDTIQLLQVVLPDPSGKLPGNPACDPAYVTLQDVTSLYQ